MFTMRTAYVQRERVYIFGIRGLLFLKLLDGAHDFWQTPDGFVVIAHLHVHGSLELINVTYLLVDVVNEVLLLLRLLVLVCQARLCIVTVGDFQPIGTAVGVAGLPPLSGRSSRGDPFSDAPASDPGRSVVLQPWRSW